MCEQRDQELFFWGFVEILGSEKCCTVMHEAIVAQLHPQDQRLLPGSAVPLHQKTRERERVGAAEKCLSIKCGKSKRVEARKRETEQRTLYV